MVVQLLHSLTADLRVQVSALTPVDPVSNTSVTLLTAPVVPANAAALPADQLPFAQVHFRLARSVAPFSTWCMWLGRRLAVTEPCC